MATSRFETYVGESIREATAEKRAKLQSAYDAEVAKIEKMRDKYLKMAEDGVEALVSKIVAQAKKDGVAVDEFGDQANIGLSEYAKRSLRSAIGLQRTYAHGSSVSRWPEGTPARRAQDALHAFDELCEKETRRLVVYKIDLGMKPEAFEKMLAEAAAKINKE